MATGGPYMSMPVNNSLGVKFGMKSTNFDLNNSMYTPAAPSYVRQVRSEYGAGYGSLGRSRPQSAPANRDHYTSSASRDAYYHTSSNPRSEFTTTEYRSTYRSSGTARPRPSSAAPYPNRTVQSFKNVAIGQPTVDLGGGAASLGLPQYDALHDPHLHEYFVRRFSGYKHVKQSKLDARLSHPRGGKTVKHEHGANSNRGKTILKDTIYKVTITTGAGKDMGTSARVFLRMKGSRGKMSKKCLSKAKNIKKTDRETKRAKSKAFKFTPGSSQSFKIKNEDIGNIKSIILEHDGLTEKDSWFVGDVDITNLNTKKSWHFSCQQWFSLFHTDCQLSRTLFSRISAITEYEVTVVTGDKNGAGTDANVFITIYGQGSGVWEQTDKIPLKTRKKDAFEKNSSDVFTIKAKTVGPMKKIRIEHDNTGRGPGWYLERVVVTDMTHPTWKYYFPCGQWLAKDEGDGAISRDLMGSKDPFAMRKSNKYKITVFTGDKRGAGTDANVYVTLFGADGESSERMLDNSKNNFERKDTDEFIIECPCLGTIQRLRIGHDNKGSSPGWYLNKVIVDDMDSQRVYEFPCNRWFSLDEDDGQISRDLYCGVGEGDAAPGIPYKIQVTTGDVSQSSTSARVYVVLHGGKGGVKNSGRIWLEGGRFDRGRTDDFNVEVAEKLSPLTKIDIGHDNSGAGPGWFLGQVTVSCPSAGITQVFPCDKWLALDEGDGVLEYTLYEQLALRKQAEAKVTWYTWVYTSDLRGAGTDANVYICVYGDKGKTDDILLDNQTNNFESGTTDKFKIEANDVGRPYKIRIWHDNSNPSSAWHLDKIEMERMDTKDRYTYKCNRWLAKDEDDGSCIREIPTEGPGIKNPLPLVKYTVEVYTGNKRGAGTDANVYLCVHGLFGDTGDRPLEKSSTNMNKFEKSEVDIFSLEAVTLKKLSKIRIGHDGKLAGAGWFLDKVIVKQDGTDKYTQAFECGRWLATDEDDGQIVREITAGGSQLLSTTSYNLTVKTGDIRGAGTDANCFIKIFGDAGDTGLLQLKSSDSAINKFEQGRLDKFPLQATDIGKIKRIRLGHDGANASSGWFVDDVVIDVPSRGETYRFALHRWLAVDEDDGKIEVELEPTEVTDREKSIPYEVTVWTSDVRNAGTDADVFIQMYGEDGKTEEYKLRNRTDNFEQNQVDKFKIEAKDVGPLQKIRVGHDGAGMMSGWHLDKVLIQRHPSKRSNRRGGKKKKREEKPLSARDKYRRKSRSGSVAGSLDSDDEEFSRSQRRRPSSRDSIDKFDRDARYGRSNSRACSRLERADSRYGDFSDDEEIDSDEDIITDRSRSPTTPEQRRRLGRDRPGSGHGERPGSARGDGRESEVRGRDGRDKKDLKNKKGKDVRGKKDGDKKGKNKRVEEIDLNEISADERDNKEPATEDYWFFSNQWFARSEGDKAIVREIIATDEKGQKLVGGLEEVEYSILVKTGDVIGAGTDANVFINLAGEHGDTGERQLKNSQNRNKFERNQDDVFKLKAVHIGALKKLRIWHDNKGGGGAWYLGHVEVTDPKDNKTYFLPCQRWLATDEDDGQISRTLVPVDPNLKSKLTRKDSVRAEIGLEQKAALQTYHVNVTTGDKWGSGTDANVYIILYGDLDDTGIVPLKATIDGTSNKFEQNQTDKFSIDAAEIGDLKKIKIGHDNAGGLAAWYLDRVDIDCPALGKKWLFPCSRWLAKNKDDGQLERELFPQDLDTEEYMPCIPYEIKVSTSDIRGADTSADVYIQIYGTEMCSQKKSLCDGNKALRKKSFKKGQADTFILELEDVGETIEKIRVGHDGSGFGSGWHLGMVSIRKLHDSGKGSLTYTFPCNRWLARDEDDGAIERELVADKVIEEITKKDGKSRTKEKKIEGKLLSKKYTINVYTGNVSGAGTDANVYCTIFGDKGDSGERKLHKSETYKDKFERNHCDIFHQEIVDLGKIFKCKIRHDNSLINPSWFLDKIEVIDTSDNVTYTFHCEKWLAKNKEDSKIERSLYVKGYDGDMSSQGTLKSFSTRFGGSTASMDSTLSDPYGNAARITKRQSMALENNPDGKPTIAYTVKIRTGEGEDNGTESHAWINIYGSKKKQTGKLLLDLIGKSNFEPASVETFSVEAIDVGEVKQLEIGHDGVTPGSGWLVKEVDLNVPSKGKHYYFACKQWLAKDKSDGKTHRMLHVQDGQSTMTSYKPMIPYEVTFYTGDVSGAGTDSNVHLTAFGEGGLSSETTIDAKGERFERGHADLIKLDLDDIAPLKKIRVAIDKKCSRPDWFLEKVDVRNMENGELYVFKCEAWIGKTKGEGRYHLDIAATVRGKQLVKTTSYRIKVKTSDERGAGTDANVFVCLFGENGDSGELHLDKSDSNKSPFSTAQEDTFTFENLLTLGTLVKCRVWHDNKGLGAAWHCSYIEVEDTRTRKKYMFPCNRWLSRSDDDKQIVRELTCSNQAETLKKGDKMNYQITIVTSDKKDASMMHNCWLILEGDKKKSREFIMKNSAVHKVFRRSNTDAFTMEGRYLGDLKRCYIGAVKRDDLELASGGKGRDDKWHLYEVRVSEGSSGSKYVFPCNKWVTIHEDVDMSDATILKADEKKTEQSKLTAVRNLAPVKYEVIVITGNVSGAGTNANVSITLYGENGDSGKRELKQRFRDLFEKNQTDKFELEILDLGELTKLRVEHDNAGWSPGWFLDKIEITNLASNKKYTFPCEQWLDQKKGDKQLYKELLPRD